MRGLAGGETTAEGPVSVGVWAATGHAIPRTEKPAAQTIAIRHRHRGNGRDQSGRDTVQSYAIRKGLPIRYALVRESRVGRLPDMTE
jgi:hypothetical protein